MVKKEKFYCPVCNTRIFDANASGGIVEIKCAKCKNIVSISLSIPSARILRYSETSK